MSMLTTSVTEEWSMKPAEALTCPTCLRMKLVDVVLPSDLFRRLRLE